MKITSTGFGCAQAEKIYFDTIMFVHFTQTYKNYTHNTETKVIKQVSIHESKHKIAQFFKDVADLMKTKVMRDSRRKEKEHYQFVLSSDEHESFPVKWFTLELDNGDMISQDIAFSVTFIEKNEIPVPFGKINFSESAKHARYREFNIKRNAFKFIANQIMQDKK